MTVAWFYEREGHASLTVGTALLNGAASKLHALADQELNQGKPWQVARQGSNCCFKSVCSGIVAYIAHIAQEQAGNHNPNFNSQVKAKRAP